MVYWIRKSTIRSIHLFKGRTYESEINDTGKTKRFKSNRCLTMKHLATKTGISKTALSSYETDELKDIPHTVITKLAKYYGVSTDYLLGLTENIKYHSIGIQELNIDDIMAELLQPGHVNNHLLCELATHPAFSKLMTGLEIYVDGFINLQIETINSALDAVRQRLSEQFHPDSDDYYMKLLDASHIEDDVYFLNIIQNDLKAVINDIRANHKKDSENAADINITDKITETFDDINNYNGNLLDLLMYYFCK